MSKFDHISSNKFAESENPNEIQLPNIRKISINVVLRLAADEILDDILEPDCNEMDDWFNIDDFCQQYLVTTQLRNRLQRALWPRLKSAFLKSPVRILQKVTRV